MNHFVFITESHATACEASPTNLIVEMRNNQDYLEVEQLAKFDRLKFANEVV